MDGREFSEVLLNGEPQEITDTAEFTYDTVKGRTRESLDFSFTVVSGRSEHADRLCRDLGRGSCGRCTECPREIRKALAEAKTVSETVAVTQQQINDAWGELLDAIHYLDFQARR